MKPVPVSPTTMMLAAGWWACCGAAQAADVSGVAREWTFTIGPVGAVMPPLFYSTVTAVVCWVRWRRR